MSQVDLSRRERQALRQREDIMEAAVEVFSRKGFHDAGMAEIAQLASFGVGTIYRLFPGGKDHIYQELKRRVLDSFERNLPNRYWAEGDPLQELRLYIAASVRAYGDYPRETIMYLREAAGQGFDFEAGLPQDMRDRFRACTSLVRRALETGMAQGRFRPMDLDSALLFLRATINCFLMRWLNEPQTHGLDQVEELITTSFLHGLSVSSH